MLPYAFTITSDNSATLYIQFSINLIAVGLLMIHSLVDQSCLAVIKTNVYLQKSLTLVPHASFKTFLSVPLHCLLRTIRSQFCHLTMVSRGY